MLNLTFIGDRRTNICGVAKIDCYKSAEMKLSSSESSAISFRDKCNCMPSCTSIDYAALIDRTTLGWEYVIKTVHNYLPDYVVPT